MNKDNKSLQVAIKHFNLKNYKKSESLLRELNLSKPNDFNILHSLGVVLGIQNKHIDSVKYFELSLKINPTSGTANFNIANALNSIGNYEKALYFFQKANKINPNNISILLNHGKCLRKLKIYDQAVANFKKVLNFDQNNYDAWFNIGIVFREYGKYNESLSAFENAIKINPKNPIIYNHKGVTLCELGLFNEALICFLNALKFKHNNLMEVYTNIISTNIDQYHKDQNSDLSLTKIYAKKILEIDTKNILALKYLGLSYLYSYEIDNALKFMHEVFKLEPDSVDSNYNLGLAYKFNKDLKKSEKYIQKAVDFDSKDSNKLTLAEIQLSQNNFTDGWKNYEFRDLKFQKISSLNFFRPYWEPSMGFGNICIWREQGLGDAILFSTILPDVIKKFNNVHLLVDKRLIKFYQENYPDISVYDYFDHNIDQRSFDYHISLSSLGKYFREDLKDFKNTSILNVSGNNFNNFNKKLKCGISWRSNSPVGKHKSINLESLKVLLEIKNIEFYDIQYTDEDDEIKLIEKKYGFKINKIENLDTHNDVHGLMQFIKSCDFTVSISNTNAHLSGILGVPTLLLLSKGAGALWYWSNEIEGKNLWYPSLKVFQQTTYSDWKDPINNLCAHLKDNFKLELNY